MYLVYVFVDILSVHFSVLVLVLSVEFYKFKITTNVQSFKTILLTFLHKYLAHLSRKLTR